MFNIFKKNKSTTLKAPVNGKVIKIEDVGDPVFAQKLMGEGFGVEPIDGKVYAPVEGVISSIFKTKHAIGITTSEGLELLIHMGIETVELKGSPFEIYVKKDDKVNSNTLLANVDIAQIKAAGKDAIILTVVTNTSTNVNELTDINVNQVDHGDEVISLTLK
jgi:PTS system glucose-specific IIA component